ncbi:MAG: flagellar hook-length control protein FliK [Thermodesulfovibrionales bacterium]|nr:flagellar hook-length control protein FliK [Thermodesulfovibrionales bacterium]
MIVSSPHIQNIQKMVSSNNQATPSGDVSQKGSGGSFMSVLSMMMCHGNNQSAEMINAIKNGDSAFDIVKDFLQNKDIDTDNSLILGFLQDILNDSQRFQELIQSLSNTDNNTIIQQLAHLNYGQMKDIKGTYIKEKLEDLLQSIKSRLNEMQDITPSDVRRVINEEIAKLFNKRNRMTEEIVFKQTAISEESQIVSSNIITDNETTGVNLFDSLVDKDSSASDKLLSQAHQDIVKVFTNSNKDKTLFNNTDELRVALQEAMKDSDIDMAFKKESFAISSNIESNSHSVNILDEIVKDLDVKEMAFSSENSQISKNSQTVVLNESPTQQVRNENAIRETLHVSRIQEIDTKILKAIQTDSKTLTLRLEPPDLGSIHIKLIMTDGSLRADLKVDNHAVKDMMNLALPQIRNTLENAGIKVSEFFVDIREEYYSDGGKHNHDRDNNRENQQDKKQKDKGFKPFEYYI